MRTRPDPDERSLSFEITPFVNVIFVLILFFMATTSFQVFEQELSTNLPSLGGGAQPPPMALEIHISANGLVAVGAPGTVPDPVDSPTSTELVELRGRVLYIVENDRDKHAIIINPHSDSIHQRVMDVLNACVKAGARNISFSS